MMRLDVATVMLQWAVGGMLFCWFTTRRREVGLGYGWLLRSTFLGLALIGIYTGVRYGFAAGRDIPAMGSALATAVALWVSVARKSAGVSGQTADHDRRSERIAAMTGIERAGRADADAGAPPGLGSEAADGLSTIGRTTPGRWDRSVTVFGWAGREFPPALDLIPVVIGAIGLVDAGVAAGGNDLLAVARTVIGAVFLGSVTDAMLLGHWYLVQPGLPRRLLNELVAALGWVWPAEVAALLIPTGMFSVLSGRIDDGWNGMLGWFWVACAVTTIALVFVTRAALRERAYSAVMAATGLLYLAILTAFGTDLVARATLAG